MLLLALAALFCWMALREIYHGFVAKSGFADPQPIDKTFVLITLLIAGAFAYLPLRTLVFERFLTTQARVLSGNPAARVHCNTFFDTMLDPNAMAAGHATPDTGRIVFQKPWCGVLMKHLRNPGRADAKGIFAVQMFVHEAMHIRGELNEAITECQAIQRHYRGAKMLGIPDAVAKAGGVTFYTTHYMERRQVGGMQAPYYSDACAPGGALDEHLVDSTWNR